MDALPARILRPVSWSESQEWIRGYRHGLPVLSYGDAPRKVLATRRQLRAMQLRPNGQEPVAYLAFRHDTGHGHVAVFAELFLIALAAPKRTATPAQHTALAKANLARRICPTCGRDVMYVIPRELGECHTCWHIREHGEPPAVAA